MNRPARVVVLSVAMTAAAFGLAAAGVVDAGAAPVASGVEIHPLLLAVLFGLAEACVVHVQLRRQTLTVSLTEIPLVLGLFFVAPVALVAARVVGSTAALLAVRRQPAVKAIFNVGLFALETAVAVAVFHDIVEHRDPHGPFGWLAAQTAAATTIVIGAFAVAAAIWLTERMAPGALLRGVTTLGIPSAFVNTTLGLLAATLLVHDSRTGALLTALSAPLYLFYRSHTRLQTSHQSLTDIYAVTRSADDALERGGAVESLLRHTTEVMRTEYADLVLSDPSGGAVRFRWDAATEQLDRESAAAIAGLRVALLGGADSVLVSRRRQPDVLERLGHHREALLAGLLGDRAVSGTLLVADRVGIVSTFSEDDRRVFEALANNASITLRNARLLEQLREEIVEREHEALHDQLTGLPNRTLFDRETEAAITHLDPGERAVVMLIDLDRFKEVNDTLGHQQGDRLLRLVSRRIAGAVGSEATVARLGGDEFGVLMPRCPSERDAVDLASRIRRVVEQPVDLDGLPIAVGASIGIATAPDDGHDAESMLQCADVAMYMAKDGTGVARYSADADHYSPERLAMVAELGKAIDRGELLVEYQPCSDLRTGAVVSAEALARWHHPHHGFVPPDVFIPIAERSGLIHGITSLVLRSAIRQCALWRRQGLDIGVAVNLSARSLLDEGLPGELEHHLLLADLPPTALTLEITESSVVADPARTVGMLNRLSSMGVTLSIDDYGTGYSSLSYLKDLPVDELKLDRSFVTDMVEDRRNAIIVRSTVALAHELGLRVVAEGIEDAATQELLRYMGCDLAQGYHISRPRTPAQFMAFARGAAPDAPAAEVREHQRPISLAERRRRVGVPAS